MALPTGTITMADVNLEIGRTATATTSLNDTIVRQTAASTAGPSVLSGTVSMNNLRGAKGTQVIAGLIGADKQNGPNQVFVGYNKTPSPLSFGFNVGTWSPAPVINLLGGQTVITLITDYNFSGAFTYLFLDAATSYTGSINVYGSETVNDPWPTGLMITLPKLTNPVFGGVAFGASGPILTPFILNAARTIRFEKA